MFKAFVEIPHATISVFSLKLSPHDTKEALHNTPIAKYKYLSFIMIVFIVSFSSSNSD